MIDQRGRVSNRPCFAAAAGHSDGLIVEVPSSVAKPVKAKVITTRFSLPAKDA